MNPSEAPTFNTSEHTHEHHHHHHHHKDDTGEYRKRMAKRAKFRKRLPKILFAIGCAIAAIVMCAVVFAYVIDR